MDGEALLLLVEDFSEFSSLVPKAVSQLKIKKFLRSLHPNSNTTESDGASASGVASTKEVICSIEQSHAVIHCMSTDMQHPPFQTMHPDSVYMIKSSYRTFSAMPSDWCEQ